MRYRTELLLLKRFLLLLALWLTLTGGGFDGVPFGLAAAALATWTSRRLAPPERRRMRLTRLAALSPGFFRRSLLGGIDVAWRALHPKLPLRPGWIAYPARLPPGAPRVLLGGEISLLPGTLVAGSDGDRLLVHCLDTGLPVARQIADEEDRLAGAVDDG